LKIYFEVQLVILFWIYCLFYSF